MSAKTERRCAKDCKPYTCAIKSDLSRSLSSIDTRIKNFEKMLADEAYVLSHEHARSSITNLTNQRAEALARATREKVNFGCKK